MRGFDPRLGAFRSKRSNEQLSILVGGRRGSNQTTAPIGFASPLTNKGDILVYGTTNDRLPVGTDGQFLQADSSLALGVKWAAQVYTEFVFDSTATQAGNVYNNWADLNTALGLIYGKKRVTFTKTSTMAPYGIYTELIPSGVSFNFDNTTFSAQGGNASQLTGQIIGIADGATIASWKGMTLENGIGLASLSTSSVFSCTNQTIRLNTGSMLISLAILGATYMISHTSGTLQIEINGNSSIYGAGLAGYGGTCINQTGGTTYVLIGSSLSVLDNNVISGTGTLSRIISEASAADHSSNTQSGFSGTLTTIDKYAIAKNVKFASSGSNLTSTDVNAAIVELDTKITAPRINTTTSSSQPTFLLNTYDMLSITALATNITSMTTNLSGTAQNGRIITYRIKDNGTARTITWGASFADYGAALPTTTVAGKVTTARFIYDSVAAVWGCVYSATEGGQYFDSLDSTTITSGGTTVPTISSTNTLTNKRITPRVGTVASSVTPTINTDNVDVFTITAQAADITSFTTNLSGTPTDGQRLHIAITDDGTGRAITWGASFEASTVALPTTTVAFARLDVDFIWNAATSKWRCIGVA